MAEQILNTRVQLKYDSYKNWVEKNPTLLAGEVAIAYLPPRADIEHTNPAPAAVATATLMKVGPGAFNSLPWLSATAADVYAWAKQENLPLVRNDGDKAAGNVISSITWEDNSIKYTTASVATSEGMAELQESVQGILDDIAANREDWAEKTVDTNTDTQYRFTTDGDKLVVYKTLYTLGVAGTEEKVGEYEFLTESEVRTILANYYAKGEIDTKFEGYYTKDEVDGLIPTELGVMSVSGKDAIVVTEGAAPEVSLKLDNSGNVTLSQGANGLKAEVTIPAQAEYSIVKDATSDYAATYHLTKDGVNVGAAINIPKDMVVESGEVKELEAGVWGEAGTYIVITLANATDDKLYINVGNLIEYVTSGSAEGDMVVVAIDETHKVTATITDGTITEAKLHADVTAKLNKVWEEVGVAQGLIDGLANGQVKTNKEAIENITKADGLIAQALAAAKEDSSSKDAVVLAEAQKASNAVQANLDAHAGNGDIHVTADQKSIWNSAVQTVSAENGLKVTRAEGSNDVTIAIDEAVTFIFNCGDASV